MIHDCVITDVSEVEWQRKDHRDNFDGKLKVDKCMSMKSLHSSAHNQVCMADGSFLRNYYYRCVPQLHLDHARTSIYTLFFFVCLGMSSVCALLSWMGNMIFFPA